MIVLSKCPYRISLLGGGTDLDWFVKKFGKGLTIGFSINSYSTIAIKLKKNKTKGILNYSSREEYQDIQEISHPIIRNCLQRISLNKSIELSSFGDDLSGGGLGSSSSFSVALIKGLSQIQEKKISNFDAAHLASEIEIKDCKNPIGRQDQYMCSLGGINILEFGESGKVNPIKIQKIEDCIASFVENLFLVDTGIKRSAFKKLTEIKNESDSYNLILNIYKLTEKFIDDCKNAQDENLTSLLEEALINSWNIKKSLTGVSNEKLQFIEQILENNDFKVFKLLGAGGGGYFLIKYTGNNLKEAREKIKQHKLITESFKIDYKGAKTWNI